MLTPSPMQQVLDAANIPEEHKSIVGLSVNRDWNIRGGRPSDAARSVVADYKANPERFVARFHAERDQERQTGHDCFGSPLRHTEQQVTKALKQAG